MTQVGFCMLSVAWVFFALTFAVGVILDDTCVAAGKRVYGEPNRLDDFLECPDPDSSLATYKEVWQTLDTAQANYGGSVTETTYGFTTNTYSVDAANVNSKEYKRNRDLLQGMYNNYDVTAATCLPLRDTTRTSICWVTTITSANYDAECGAGGNNPTGQPC